jgi:hypothetical protein
MKTIKELFPGATELGFKYEGEGGNGTYTGEYIQETLVKWADEWIEHFRERFDIKDNDMPKDVRMQSYHNMPTWVYGKAFKDYDILTWTIVGRKNTTENIEEYRTKLPGASIIAFIMYNLGLEKKTMEKINEHDLAVEVTLTEGKKESVDIANTKEIINIVLNLLSKYSDEQILELIHRQEIKDEPSVESD